MRKNKIKELWIDPSSGDFSASRFILCILLLIYFPLMVSLEAFGIRLGMWAQFALIVGSVAGIYFGSSTLRVWRGKVIGEGNTNKEVKKID